jgi:predicted nuclease of predicted toxin-antitoxin system
VKLKVDENIGRTGIEFLRQRGHDAIGVRQQGLGGKADRIVFGVCVAESRTLITLDRDFGQVTRFPPKESAGIVVLDLGGPASLSRLLDRLRGFLALAASRPIAGELWIVEAGRVRVHLAKDEPQ